MHESEFQMRGALDFNSARFDDFIFYFTRQSIVLVGIAESCLKVEIIRGRSSG